LIQDSINFQVLPAYAKAKQSTERCRAPLPGDVTAKPLARLVGDVATLPAKLSKRLRARLLPAAGLKPGDRTALNDPNLVNTVFQPLP
jgi:hypothetical protein